jgi:hypothetical protein
MWCGSGVVELILLCGVGQGVVVSDVPFYDQLLAESAGLRAENAELGAENDELKRMFAVLTQRVVELERQLSADSSNSSRPPSSDAPWVTRPAEKRFLRPRSGRKPGKQQGAFSTSRRLVEDPDEVTDIVSDRCRRGDASGEGGGGTSSGPADFQAMLVLRDGNPPDWDTHDELRARWPRRARRYGSDRRRSPAPRCSHARTPCRSVAPATCWKR